MRRTWPAVAVVGGGFVAWGEWLNRRWSRTVVSDRREGSLVVVVPGFRNRQSTANAINRRRARIGVRSSHDHAATLVFSGGAVAGERAEAELMAEYATTVLGFSGPVVIEDRSRTSWENVSNVLALVEHGDRIAIASQPARALKIRAYLRRQRPDLAERLVCGADYRSGEWGPLAPVLALYGLWTLRGLEPGERRIG